MRQALYIAFTIFAVLSFLACFASMVLWPSSHLLFEEVRWSFLGDSYAAGTRDGHLGLRRTIVERDPDHYHHETEWVRTDDPQAPDPFQSAPFGGLRWDVAIPGFRTTTYGWSDVHQRYVVIHFALVVVLTAMAPLAWLIDLRRRRRKARLAFSDVCKQCGYDLRPSPDRCPECGSIPTR